MNKGRLKLEAKTSYEKIVLKYLEVNVSEDLAERINNGKKTLSQCWNYITSEAKKQAVQGCACIEDSTVFGWATHFFEEDSIDGATFDKAKVEAKVSTTESDEDSPTKEEKTTKAPSKKAKQTVVDTSQTSLFDLL